MKSKTLLMITGLLCFTSLSVYAEQDVLVSRSAGKLVQDDSIDLTTDVKKQDLVINQAPAPDQTRETTATQSGSKETVTANRDDQFFSIYDANVSSLADLDGDGFHHAINVSFDVDVSFENATVYAKLYLSRDGGPWNQYHTTNLFEIYGDDYGDAYEVTTELVDGYPPGYYDILIEVFSLNHGGIVTSQILDYYYLGKLIKLEDLSRDEVYYYDDGYFYEEVSVSYGVGSFSMIWLLLVFQVVTAARRAFPLAPEE